MTHSDFCGIAKKDDAVALLAQLAPDVVTMEPDASRELALAVGGLPLALVLLGGYLHVYAHGKRPRMLRLAIERLQQTEARLHLEEPKSPFAVHPSLPMGAWISLRAVIGSSFDALDPEARLALFALSVFPPKGNTFSEEAALAISGTSPEVLDKLILNYGLLESGGEDCYTLHQTICDYVRSKLCDQDPWIQMVEYYTNFTWAYQSDFKILDQEITNILAALKTAMNFDMSSHVVQISNALYQFWRARGLYITAETQLHQAYLVAEKTGNLGGQAQTQRNLGRMAVVQGNYNEAEKLYREALALAEIIGDDERICACQQSLGALAVRQGNPILAQRILHDALGKAREITNPGLISSILLNLGVVAANQGNLAQAEKLYQEALSFARQEEDHRRIGLLLHNLGGIASELGNHAQAETYYSEAWGIAEQSSNQERVCMLLGNLGMEAYFQGQYEHANNLFNQGLEIAQQLGHPMMIGRQFTNLGIVATALDRYDKARSYYQKALAIAQTLDLQWDSSYIYNRLGECFLRYGKLSDAVDAFIAALEKAEQAGYQEQIARAYLGLAQIEKAKGEVSQSVEYAQKSLEIFRRLGHRKTKDVQRLLEAIT